MSVSRTARPASWHHADGDANADDLMPPYEPMSTPLNAKAGAALSEMLKNSYIKDLRKHLQFAVEKLAESAGEINERVTDGRLRYEKSVKKRQHALKQQAKTRAESEEKAEGEDNNNNNDNDNDNEGKEQVEDEAEKQRLDDYEQRVKEVTSRLDEKVRTIIDVNSRVDEFADVVKDIAKEVTRDTQMRQIEQAQRQQQAAGRRRRVVDGGEEEEDDDGGDEQRDAAAEDDQPPPEPPSKKVRERLEKHMREWQQLSMTERYANTNVYGEFYRIVHEAKHPQGELPPLPDKSTWFSHLEKKTRNGRGTTSTTEDATSAAQEAEEDVDIAVARERVSLKCPLTQQMFVNPVRNTKCVHAFERSAIEEFIERSDMTIPLYNTEPDEDNQNQRPRRARGPVYVRAVECPVCSAVITRADLRRDPVLERRVRRAQMAAQGEGEDEDEEEEEEQEEATPVVTKTEDGAPIKTERPSGRRPRTLYIEDDAIED